MALVRERDLTRSSQFCCSMGR